MNPIKIAVYGTLKQWYGNNRLMRNCKFLWTDFVPFTKIAGTWFPIAKFEWASNDKLLKVELYEVSNQDDLSNIDSLEWHPNWYKRIPVTTISNKLVQIYDMFSQEFEDMSNNFKIDWTKNLYEWTRI